MIKEIKSVNNPYIKELSKLKTKKHRDEARKFLVEGFHLVEEAKEYLETILVCKDVSEKIRYQKVDVIYVTQEIIEKLSSTKTPQRIIGVCKMREFTKPKSNLILALDGLQDPGNIGTIIRSAISFGIEDVLLSEDAVDIYNEKIIRATQGAIFKVNVCNTNLFSILQKLKKEKYRIISTALKDAKPLDKIDKSGKVVLVMGNEGNGVSPTILDISDERAYIPIQKMESLNVSVACGICLYEFRR